jgi:glycosyltransferase involved in cell wall biosynthesis
VPSAGDARLAASIVIPVNHRPEFIGRAIESVQRQTVGEVEVIVVVNGGASDPTADVVRGYMKGGARHDPSAPEVRLIVVDINNLGLCLNTGIAAARGRYYVQLDSDDRLKPDAVAKLLAVFESDPTIGMVVGSYEVWDLDAKTGELSRNAKIPVVTHDEWTAENGRNNLLRINGAGAPRSAQIGVIREAGWFGVNDDPSCRNYGEDYDLVLRISERWTIGRVWDPIYEVIRHSGGTDHSIDQATIDRNDNAKDNMRLAALKRRRLLNAECGLRNAD